MKWGVRKDDQSAFHTNYAYTDDQGGVIKKKDIINRLKNEINFYNKNLNEITDKKAKKYLQQLTVEERNKRKKEAEAEMNSFLKSFSNVDDDTDIMVDVNPVTGQSKLYIKKSNAISHGGPGFDNKDYIAHYGVKGMKWGVRKDDYEKDPNYEKRLSSNFPYSLFTKGTGVIKKQEARNEINKLLEVYKKDPKTEKSQHYVNRFTSELKAFNNAFNNLKDDDNIYVDVTFKSGVPTAHLYTKKSNAISHGGPGSGRYPKGFKMAKTIAEETKNATSAVQKAIPSRYNYQVSTHPSYDELSDEYMRKVINRKNLETDYAKAVGELKQKPSKGKIAMEALEIIGTIAAIGVSASVIGLNATNINKESKKENK